jgi:hypothetical protein
MEWIKALSDKLLIWFFRVTSRFGKELTFEGRLEQAMWRDRRLRDLEGLALRSRQRLENKKQSA